MKKHSPNNLPRLSLTGIRSYLLLLTACGCVFSAASAVSADRALDRSQTLLKGLQAEASFYDKARACQQAGEFGTAELVSALAALLADEKLSAYARSGLENIPDPSAAAALRNALKTLKGDVLCGVINSLGTLRDEQAVAVLQKLAADPKSGVGKEAYLALGMIANERAVKTLLHSLESPSADCRAHAASGCLLAAQHLRQTGETDEARKLYDAVLAAEIPSCFKSGAVYGAIVSRKSEGVAFLVDQLISSEPEIRKGARFAAQDFPKSEVAEALCKALDKTSAEQKSLIQTTLQQIYYKPLITGKRFQGWEGDTKKSFQMEDGAIVGGTLKEKIPRNEFLATTREYTNFILRAECKLAGDACNAGIQFRTQRIPNHHEVKGYQADMSMGQDGGYWGKLYDESRRNKTLGKSINRSEMIKQLKTDGWNQYEIRCEGQRIQLFVNDIQTLDYTEEDASIPLHGLIAVQIHSGLPSQAWYRNIQIVELP